MIISSNLKKLFLCITKHPTSPLKAPNPSLVKRTEERTAGVAAEVEGVLIPGFCGDFDRFFPGSLASPPKPLLLSSGR